MFVGVVWVCQRMNTFMCLCTCITYADTHTHTHINIYNKYILPKLAQTHKLKNQIC